MFIFPIGRQPGRVTDDKIENIPLLSSMFKYGSPEGLFGNHVTCLVIRIRIIVHSVLCKMRYAEGHVAGIT